MKTPKQFGRAVLIGLGGTGQKALVRIKKRFIDNCGVVPPCVRFLAFDTDSNRDEVAAANGSSVRLNEDEFCHLKVNLVRAAIENPYVQPWWITYPKLENIAISDGAGGIREAGRLSLFENIATVISRIKRAYQCVNAFNIERAMKDAGFDFMEMSSQVVVIGSFAGGTGSGTFFDISILCRHLGGDTSKYLAYFMMPSVYRDIANTADENTYASLVELDHLTQSSKLRPFDVQYAHNVAYTLKECPYHVINLVDGVCEDGSLIEQPKELVGFIAESVYNLTGAIGKEAKTVGDNILAMKNSVPPEAWSNKGATAIYSTIGCSAIYYPAPEIHAYKSNLATAEILRKIVAAEQEPGTAEVRPESIEGIVTKYELRPEMGVIGKKLLPDNERESKRIVFDEDDFDDDVSTDDVRDNISAQRDRIEAEAADSLAAATSTVRQEASQELEEFLNLTLQKEKKLELPAGARDATLRAAIAFFEQAGKEMAGQIKENETGLLSAEESYDNSLQQLAQKKSVWFLGKGARLKCGARCYAAANEKTLLSTDKLTLRHAQTLYGDLVKLLRAKVSDIEKEKSESARFAMKLETVAAQFESNAANLVPSVIKSHESKFEYYVGIEMPKAADDGLIGTKSRKRESQFWTDASKPIAPAGELFERIKKSGVLDDSQDEDEKITYDGLASIMHLPAEEVGDAVLHFTRVQYKPILEVSVLEALRGLEKQKPGEMEWIVKNALGSSKLLLRLKPQNAPAHQKYLREFTVFGMGHFSQEQMNKDRQEVAALIPEDEKMHNIPANTQDPYRISFNRFYAAFPAYDMEGIEAIRRAYNERVSPPAHLDKNLLFKMEDLFPQDSNETYALKLMTLATLDCFHLVKRVRIPTGGSYYEPAPDIEAACAKDHDVKKKLPGAPGKFYSLVSALADSQHEALAARMQKVMSERAGNAEFSKAFLASVRRRHEEIERILDNMQSKTHAKHVSISGGDGERQVKGVFNKTITGIYYTREKRFLETVMEREAFLADRSGKGGEKGDIISLLLNPENGFDI